MIDHEKVPDAPRATIRYAGVMLTSRYGKQRDLETMMRAVDYVADRDRVLVCLIRSIFCDTKACSVYSIECRFTRDVPFVAEAFDRAFRDVNGGHNGIDAAGKNGAERVDVDPWWEHDEEEIQMMKARGPRSRRGPYKRKPAARNPVAPRRRSRQPSMRGPVRSRVR